MALAAFFRTTLLRRPVLGETLYHLRPFINLYLLKRARERSWTPWVVSLCKSHRRRGMALQTRPCVCYFAFPLRIHVLPSLASAKLGLKVPGASAGVEAAALSLLRDSPESAERFSPVETIELQRRYAGLLLYTTLLQTVEFPTLLLRRVLPLHFPDFSAYHLLSCDPRFSTMSSPSPLRRWIRCCDEYPC